MNIKSKLICISTTAILTFTLIGYSFAASSFTDISNEAHKEKIIVLHEKGYINGLGKGLFSPKGIITAAEGIQMIVNVLDLNIDNVRFIKEPKATDYFPKAKNDAWYSNALIIAAVKGLNIPADTDPKKVWTREEFTYYLITAMEANRNMPMIKIIPANITDGDKITPEYEGAIQRALVYGIDKLDERGKFNPKAKMTRAEAAAQIYNVLEYFKAHPIQAEDESIKLDQ
ncbi:S-layer homology domain-containing protein [Pseudobacteroides cellulosolvens]|nr:S-layer homology domain-containing protein [Pseudobacteroides cellulosolvens]